MNEHPVLAATVAAIIHAPDADEVPPPGAALVVDLDGTRFGAVAGSGRPLRSRASRCR